MYNYDRSMVKHSAIKKHKKKRKSKKRKKHKRHKKHRKKSIVLVMGEKMVKEELVDKLQKRRQYNMNNEINSSDSTVIQQFQRYPYSMAHSIKNHSQKSSFSNMNMSLNMNMNMNAMPMRAQYRYGTQEVQPQLPYRIPIHMNAVSRYVPAVQYLTSHPMIQHFQHTSHQFLPECQQPTLALALPLAVRYHHHHRTQSDPSISSLSPRFNWQKKKHASVNLHKNHGKRKNKTENQKNQTIKISQKMPIQNKDDDQKEKKFIEHLHLEYDTNDMLRVDSDVCSIPSLPKSRKKRINDLHYIRNIKHMESPSNDTMSTFHRTKRKMALVNVFAQNFPVNSPTSTVTITPVMASRSTTAGSPRPQAPSGNVQMNQRTVEHLKKLQPLQDVDSGASSQSSTVLHTKEMQSDQEIELSVDDTLNETEYGSDDETNYTSTITMSPYITSKSSVLRKISDTHEYVSEMIETKNNQRLNVNNNQDQSQKNKQQRNVLKNMGTSGKSNASAMTFIEDLNTRNVVFGVPMNNEESKEDYEHSSSHNLSKVFSASNSSSNSSSNSTSCSSSESISVSSDSSTEIESFSSSASGSSSTSYVS